MYKFDPSTVHTLTPEEEVQALMRYGYPKEKATEIVKAGKFAETVEDDYMSLVADPIGSWEAKQRKAYFYRTSDPEKANQ